jgi:hypothetical protein
MNWLNVLVHHLNCWNGDWAALVSPDAGAVVEVADVAPGGTVIAICSQLPAAAQPFRDRQLV